MFGINEILGIVLIIIASVVTWLVIEFKEIKIKLQARPPQNNGNSVLQLQAYERLTLLTERISLKNMVMKIPTQGVTSSELQAVMINTINTEYDYNVTQQIYINPEVWAAIQNMKDQNIFIINQLSATMPNNAPAIDLSKILLQYLENENADLSSIVLNAIQFEAKQLL